ncbi:hypothetical protein [Tsukamurella pseudospumae]|uniref:Uncharacterized protein n=1 Tax=Tsukamurella pseudospumae TaxID=239498 RepID=A0A137ZRS7_9ACTN|nr:hypothetical protein [Tsukamurella pseudospumae]KXP00903.1 hypothetical protein AXK61_12910 [Tsukamurella pseudospumae]
MRGRFTAIAVELLWRRTGRVFGLTARTVRPYLACDGRPSTYEGEGGVDWYPIIGFCAPSRRRVALPGPVHEVLEVRVDGAAVLTPAWEIREHRWLVRIDPAGEWPAPVEPGPGFEIDYVRGVPVPLGGQEAAGALAHELWKAADGQDCGLPENVRTVSRQGMSMEMVDMAALIGDQATGVPSVDRWIASVNPFRTLTRPEVFSPDIARGARVMR